MISRVLNFFNSIKESLEKERDSSNLKIMEQRFDRLKSNEYFLFLDLYNPMDYPLEITSEHIANFIENKRKDGFIVFEHYLKCDHCSYNFEVSLELDKEEKCVGCKNNFSQTKENIFLRFKKL